MNDKVKRKLSTNKDAWNNKWFLYVGGPVFAAIGVFIGWMWFLPLVSAFWAEAVVLGLCIGTTYLIGMTLLAYID